MADTALLKFATVEKVLNDGSDRIYVLLPTDNADVQKTNELTIAFPLLPKFLSVKPKEGEMVLLVKTIADKKDSIAFYIGPIIAQKEDMYYCASKGEYDKYFIGGTSVPLEHSSSVDKAFSENNDISLEGRKNCNVILKDNDAIISAGLRVCNFGNDKTQKPTFYLNNDNTQSFIDLRYDEDKKTEEDGYKSSATIVANKINLIGQKSKYDLWKDIEFVNEKGEILPRIVDKNDKKQEDIIDEIINSSSPLPYGDKLIEFLDLFRTAFIKHVHRFKTPVMPKETDSVMKLQEFDLNTLLSDNVRIN